MLNIYGDKREMIITYVSSYGNQRQSNKELLGSNEVAKSPSLHIEHLNSHDEIQTRTSQAKSPAPIVIKGDKISARHSRM